MPLQVENISATVGIDISGLKQGIGEARKSLESLTQSIKTEGDRAAAASRSLMQWYEGETNATKGLNDAKRQGIAYEKELRIAKAQLTAVLNQESQAAQQVAGKYTLLSQAQRQQLAGIKEQITAQKALQEAELVAASAAEKAAVLQAAAATKAADAQVAQAKRASDAEEAAAAKRLATARKNVGKNLETVGGSLAGGVTTPLVGLGIAAVGAGMDVQNAEMSIRARTGASGAQLAGLDEAMKHVAANVPQTMSQVSQAISGLAIRTGLTGTALENLATQELNLARVTNSDVGETVTKTTQLFSAWGVATANQAGTLDLLYRASQASGIKINELAGNLTRFAPTMKTLGFNIADSAALLASFEKAGVPPQRMIFGLTSALSRLAKVGITDAHQALLAIIQQLQHAKTPMEALTEAGKLFGARMGTNVVDAIRSGKFNLEALEKTILSGKDTIKKAADDTETFGVAWGKFRNKAELALAPLGELILKIGTQLLDALKPAMQKVTDLTDAFSSLPGGTQKAVVGILAVAATIGPLVIGISKFVVAAAELKAALIGLGLVAETTELGLAALSGPIGLAILAIGVLTAAWMTDFGHIRTGIEQTFHNLSDALGPGLALTVKTAKQHLQDLKQSFGDAFDHIANHPALKSGLAATGNALISGAEDTPAGQYWAQQRKAEQRAPAIRAWVNDYFNKHSLDMGPKLIVPGEAAARAHPAAVAASAAQSTDPWQSKYADLLKKLHEAEQGPAKKAKVAKLTPLEKEQQEYASAAASAHERLTAVLAGEDNIAGQVAGKYRLMHLNGRDDLTTTLQRIKSLETHAAAVKRVKDEINRLNADTRSTDSYDPGAKFLANVPGLSTNERDRYGAEITKAKEHNDYAHGADQEETDRVATLKANYDAVAQSVADLHRQNMAAQADAKYGPFNRESLALLSQFADHYSNLSHSQQKVIDQLRGQRLTDQAFKDQAADQKAYGDTYDKLAEKLKALAVEKMQLLGIDQRDQVSLDLTNQLYNDLDDTQQAMIDVTMARTKANEDLAASQAAVKKADEAANKALEEHLAAYQKALDLQNKTEGGTNVSRLDPNAIFGQTTLLGMAGGMVQLKTAQILDAAEAAKKKAAEVKQAWNGAAQSFESVFDQAFGHLNQGFKGFFASIVQGFEQMLQQMAAKYLASQITDLFFGKADSNGDRSGGLLGSLIGIFTGTSGRASGGLVSQDTPYLVGENGPELMVPRSSGRVVPHAQTAAAMTGGGHTFNMTVVTQDANSFNRSHHQIASDYTRMMQQANKRNGR